MSSENAHDADGLVECFASDATVRDEGRTRAGLTDIAAWRRETTEKYHHAVEPVAIAERDEKRIVATLEALDVLGKTVEGASRPRYSTVDSLTMRKKQPAPSDESCAQRLNGMSIWIDREICREMQKCTEFPEIFPAARSRSTSSSGSRTARSRRWRFSRKAEQKNATGLLPSRPNFCFSLVQALRAPWCKASRA